MADVRVTTGSRSRIPGTQVGLEVNVFGMTKLQAGINGEFMAEVGVEALQPAYQDAYLEWAVLTGASRDSIEIAVSEVGERLARVVLQAGGEKLMTDPRNHDHTDYAPFLEFNGSPSGSQSPGAIARAIFSNDRLMREIIHQKIRERVLELTSE